MTAPPQFSLAPEVTLESIREAVKEVVDAELSRRARIDPVQHQADHAFVQEQRQRWDRIAEYVETQIERDRARADFYRSLVADLQKWSILGLVGSFVAGLGLLVYIGLHEWINGWLHGPAIPPGKQ